MIHRILVIAFLLLATGAHGLYPLDGYEHSGIRRLKRTRAIAEGKMPGRKPPAGALKSIDEIQLNLQDDADTTAYGPASADPELQRRVRQVFAGRDPNYSLSLLDITPGRPHRAAFYRSDLRYQPGSLGKLAIVAGLFTELAAIFPDDTEARLNLLRTHMVTAGPWVRSNHHTIPVYDPETGAYASRHVLETDTFSLFEWADHAISASSNAAASVLWKEVVLMRAFGAAYPPSPEEEKAYFESTPRAELGELGLSVVNDPLRAIGISEETWRLGSFFTNYAESFFRTPGGSWGTTEAFLTFLAQMERGRLVDPWSSLEIKRLMYQTERRIRYAASPELAAAAVYFKSGSLYKCQQEEGFECGQYMGNAYNYMNSAAVIETPDGRVYIAVLMSNVLRINSASEHLAMATQIERIMRG